MRSSLFKWFLLAGIIFLFPARHLFAQNIKAPRAVEAEEQKPTSDNSDVPIENISSKNDIPARVIFLRLEEIAEAKIYEVQIRPQNKSWAEPYKIKTSRAKMRFRLSPGRYDIRTRSLDEKNKRGSWLAWQKFQVPFRQPENVYPKDGLDIEAKGELSERLTFEWPKIRGAAAYRFKLYGSDGTLIRHVVTKENWLANDLSVNSSYAWSLIPMSSLKDEDQPEYQKQFKFSIMPPDKSLKETVIQLAAAPKASKYEFELVRMLGEDETSEPTVYSSREPLFRARIAPGTYELRVRTVYDDESKSGWGRPSRLFVRVPPIVMTEPKESAEPIEPVDDLVNRVHLKWEKSKWADKYRLKVFNSNNEVVIDKTLKEAEMDIEVPHNEKYHWTVKGLLPLEEQREVASISEKTKEAPSEFSVGEYVKLSLSSSEEPSQLYAWSRFIFSNVSYSNVNYDNNNRVRQYFWASTGELAAGYWHRKTSFGALLQAGLTGINVGGKSATFNQASLLFGYRKRLDDDKRMRLWIGPGLKETPEVTVDGATGRSAVQKIKSVGVSTLGSYLDTISGAWGYHLYAGTFTGLGGSTPNGLDQRSYTSYFGSAYLTYRMSQAGTVLFGYTYQNDQAGYRSNDPGNKTNEVSYSGHYISASLIFGLQDPQK